MCTPFTNIITILRIFVLIINLPSAIVNQVTIFYTFLISIDTLRSLVNLLLICYINVVGGKPEAASPNNELLNLH